MGKISEKVNICVYITESLWCIPETNAYLKINYISIKIKKKRRGKIGNGWTQGSEKV